MISWDRPSTRLEDIEKACLNVCAACIFVARNIWSCCVLHQLASTCNQCFMQITFCCLTGGLLAIRNRDDVPVAFALEAYAHAEFSSVACIINVHAATDLHLRVYHTRSFSNLSNVSIDNVMCACGCVRVFMWQEQTWAPSRGLQFALGVLPSLAVLSPRPPSLARYTYENDSLSLLTL